jgi:hypothetical protein
MFFVPMIPNLASLPQLTHHDSSVHYDDPRDRVSAASQQKILDLRPLPGWNELGDLFYRGQFSQVILYCEQFPKNINNFLANSLSYEINSAESPLHLMLKTLALLEQHHFNGAKDIFSRVMSSQLPRENAQLGEDCWWIIRDLIKSKIESRQEDFTEAFETILPVVDFLMVGKNFPVGFHVTSSGPKFGFDPRDPIWKRLRYLCALDYCERLMDLGRLSEIDRIIQFLEHEEPFQDRDVKLSFMLLRSRYYMLLHQDDRRALSFAQKCYGEAIQIGWTYFSARAQILMALCYKNLNDTSKYSLTLSFLKLSLEGAEHQFLTYWVNDQFKQDSVVTTPMEFDSHNRRVFVSGQWLALHDRPILFEFLKLLHEKVEFTSKKVISERLWPNEIYKPRIHDPRIFDIAKRVRSMIEPYRSQPLTLLSGRMGYKLASH